MDIYCCNIQEMEPQVLVVEYPSVLIAHINTDSALIHEHIKKAYREGKLIIKGRDLTDEEKERLKEYREQEEIHSWKRRMMGL